MFKAAALLKELREESKSVARESAAINLRRISIGAGASIVINLLVVIVYSSPQNVHSDDTLWGGYVVTAHTAMMAYMSAALIASLVLRRQSPGWAAYVLQYATVIVLVASGTALAAIDQIVTTNITPYIILCIIAGTVFLIRPRYTFFIFLASYTVFYFIIALAPHPYDVVLSNRSDGFAVAVIGFIISFIMWRYHLLNMRQRKRIQEQQKKLEEIAYKDSLTGLLNRRGFDDIIKNEIVNSQSGSRESSLVLFDLDLFKNINDDYGHPAGDSVLIQLGELLIKSIRKTDTLCRLGGEEFILLLPGTALAEATAVAENLRSLIEKYPFMIAGSEVHVTASFGVSRLDYNLDPTLISQYSAVDKALYTAKSQGRNRVVAV